MAKKVNRRSVLKSSGIGLAGISNFSLFTQTVLDGIFNQALAQQMGLALNKKYIFIQQAAAPPRWFFDGALYPDNDRTNFQQANQVGTRYAGGRRYTDLEYATHVVEGLHMPWLWRFGMMRPGGGVTPMSNLAAEGMLIVRGADTNNPAHAAAQGLQSRPLGIKHTINSLAADIGGLPVAAVDYNSSRFQFASSKGLASTRISNGGNPIQKLMEPFEAPNVGGFESEMQLMAQQLRNTRGILDQMAKNKHPGAEVIANSTESAIQLLGNDFGNLTTVYNNLRDKYRSLINRAISPARNLAGINDKAVGSSGGRDDQYRYGGDNGIDLSDLRDMIGSTTNANRMADHFACAEFCIVNNISSSITITPGGLSNITHSNSGNRRGQFFDEHRAGKMPSLMVNTYYYLALTSCMYELIQRLKAANMWNDTVMRLDGEFGRCPQNGGTGSDHSARGNVMSLLSGNLRGLSVVGNITRNGGQNRNNTWGYGAANPGYGIFNLGHTTSTIAHILGVNSPVTAVETLLKQDGNKLVPKMGTGKIV